MPTISVRPLWFILTCFVLLINTVAVKRSMKWSVKCFRFFGLDKLHFCSTVFVCYCLQSGRKCGVGSQRTCNHFSALSAFLTIFDKEYHILTCRYKRESYLIVFRQHRCAQRRCHADALSPALIAFLRAFVFVNVSPFVSDNVFVIIYSCQDFSTD